jgi:uncharacterized protein (UPF0333 family)
MPNFFDKYPYFQLLLLVVLIVISFTTFSLITFHFEKTRPVTTRIESCNCNSCP